MDRVGDGGGDVCLRRVVIDDLWAKLPKDALQVRVADVVLVELCLRMDVLGITGRKIVDDGHLVALGTEADGDVRADEASAAGDENSHG